MSLINEALKRAEIVGRDDQTPPAKRSTHSVEHLYGDKAPAGPASSADASAEEISRLLRKNQTSLRGATALGVCVVAAVAIIMHLTLPPNQQGPVEAEAGGTTAALEMRTHQPADETKTTPDKTPEKSTIAALQQTLAGIINGGAAQTPKPARQPEPPAAVPSVPGKQKPDGQQATGQFTLSGILASGGGGHAIVNNQMVTVGDNIDGARVVAIGKHHVVLEKDSKQFVLRM